MIKILILFTKYKKHDKYSAKYIPFKHMHWLVDMCWNKHVSCLTLTVYVFQEIKVVEKGEGKREGDK